MADSDSETTSTEPHSPKSKPTKVNFVLLKQILDDESIEITDSEEPETNSKENQNNRDRKSARKSKREEDSCGPIGTYPVTFSKRCKSKSCQTRLSAFPLFSVPADTEWISEEEENTYTKKEKRKSTEKKKITRKRRNSSNEEKKKEKEAMEKIPEKTKNADGTRKDFHSEHQLKDTKNPIIQAWIQSKNKLSRKTRKEERKEKRAQRAAIEEEERLKMERYEASEKKVREWFKVKRKEARKLWRQNHPRVSPFDMVLDDKTEASPPSPEYKVFKTFKQNHSSSKPRTFKDSNADSASVFSSSQAEDIVHVHGKIEESNLGSKSSTNSLPQRPKTASYSRPIEKTKKLRPKTAEPAAKEEEKESNDNPSKQMKSLSYDEWLKSKRELEKKRVIERRRELIDSHLDAVISKLGKQRVDNIMSSRKHIDTGLKNFSRDSPPKSTSQKRESYKWRKNHDAPRPEPQGCDCPEAEHIDSDSKFHLNPSPTTSRRKANEFCKEITEKCDELKPSMEKVLAVLDSEVKKCSSTEKKAQIIASTKPAGSTISTANATCNDYTDNNCVETLSVPGTVVDNETTSRPRSSRPKSAKPKLVNNTSLTSDEAKKKIFHDMDVLGLCHSDENLGNSIAMTTKENNVAMTTEENNVAMTTDGNFDNRVAADKSDIRSTVRRNYFDYGTDLKCTPTIADKK